MTADSDRARRSPFVLFAIIVVLTVVLRRFATGGVRVHRLTPLAARRCRGRSGLPLLALGVVLYLGPFLIQFVTSFKTDADAAANPVSLIPDPVTLDAWRTVGRRQPGDALPGRPLAGQQLHRHHLGHARPGGRRQPGRLRPGPAAVPRPRRRARRHAAGGARRARHRAAHPEVPRAASSSTSSTPTRG